jgi:hypothetical protein
MIRLDATTKKLQAFLSGAPATNQLQVLVSYSDHSSSGYAGGSQASTTNSSTAVDICDAPAAGVVRDVDQITISNRDTAAVTVTVVLDVSGTDTHLFRQALEVDETLQYVHGVGWSLVREEVASSSNHQLLTNLPWEDSGHTGTASTLAGFTGAGAADNITVGSGLSLAASVLTASGGTGTLPYSAPSGMRLTTESGVGASTSDRTAQGTIYLTPYISDFVCIPAIGSPPTDFEAHYPGEKSLALTAASGSNYDVFLWNNAGTPTLALSSAWTNGTTRADALGTLKGIVVNNAAIGSMGAKRGLWLGTIRASGANVTADSKLTRYVWNWYNQVSRPLLVADATVSWTYTSTTIRSANNSTANRVQVVVGAAGARMDLRSIGVASNATAVAGVTFGIGEDSTTVLMTDCMGRGTQTPTGAYAHVVATVSHLVPLGFHFYQWLESGDGVTAYTAIGTTGTVKAGINGWVMG